MRIWHLLHGKSLFALVFLAVLSLLALAVPSFLGTLASSSAGSKNAVPQVNPGDWPMYGRDFQRTSFNPDETSIDAGNVDQLISHWQMFIGSNGDDPSGAPSVSEGKVFVGSSASGDNFFAFNAVTGVQAWHTSVGYQSSCFNVGIGSTSAISGTVLSVGGGDSAFYGLDTNNGSQLWRNPMDLGPSAFAWESPLLAYGRSYLGMASRCDNPSVRGEVRAVDMNNGTAINSQYFVPAGEAGAGVWNSPSLSPDGSTLVVATGEDYNGYNGPYNRAIVSLDPITLAIIQHYQEGALDQDEDFGTTPVIFHDSQDRILVGAGHKNDKFYTFVLDDLTAGPLWMKNTGTQVGMMPAYDPTFGDGGTLFIVGSNQLYAVDPATGNNRWTPVSIGNVHGNMAIANGLIYTNENGRVDVRNESNGSIITTLIPDHAGGNNSGPVVSNGFVYFLSGSYINAWGLPGTPSPTAPTATRTPTRTFTPTPTRTPTSLPTATPTNTPTPAPTQTPGGPTATPIPTNTPTAIPTSTQTVTPTSSPTDTPTTAPTQTPGGPTATSQPSSSPIATSSTTSTVQASVTIPVTPTACTLQFTDVPSGSTFYPFIHCLACLGIISGYDSGCSSGNPCFHPGDNVTRGQLAKIASNAAGFQDPPGNQIFEDVVPGSTFYDYVQRLASRGYISGYPCGGPGEQCIPPANRPYYRPGTALTRGQISKIVSNAAEFSDVPIGRQFEDIAPASTFYAYIYRLTTRDVMSGYPCGTPPAGLCIPPENLPYFRPDTNATRGQTSKIVANTFFPGCDIALNQARR